LLGLTVKELPPTDPLIPDPEAADIDDPETLRDKGIL